MIHNYSNFLDISKSDILNEGSTGNPQTLYWNDQFNDIKDKDWTEISTIRYNSEKYIIQFKAGENRYDYFGVIVDFKNKSNEEYYLENPKPVLEKLKNDFWKLPHIYIKNLKYKPGIFGDLSHIEDSDIYNL